MPKVSIILTLHNQQIQLINECINSLLNQSFKDFEIICIDDYSSVNYAFLEDCSKVLYVRNGRNLGLCASVNKAFRLVKSEYVVRLGCDDLFEPEMLQKEVEFLDKHKSYIAVCCELQKFGLSTAYIKRPEKWSLKRVCFQREIIPTYKGYGYAGSMMFRASALDTCRINEKYKICEDFDFHLQLLEHGKIKSIHESLYLYRSHASNYCKRFNQDYKTNILKQILKEHKLLNV